MSEWVRKCTLSLGCNMSHTMGDFVSHCTCHLWHHTCHGYRLCRYRWNPQFLILYHSVMGAWLYLFMKNTWKNCIKKGIPGAAAWPMHFPSALILSSLSCWPHTDILHSAAFTCANVDSYCLHTIVKGGGGSLCACAFLGLAAVM